MFGKLNTEEIETLIHNQVIGRIGCHADGLTYVVPISYGYDGSYIYCRGFEGLKMEIMRKNPKVCVEVDDTADLTHWQSVIAWGVFEEIQDAKERDLALKILLERRLPILTSQTMHLTPQWPFPVTDTKDIPGIVFRIRLTEKTGRFEKLEARSSYEDTQPD